METLEPNRKFTNTTIYLTALDSTVNVNSLFMLAVFIGLAWNPMDPNYSLITDPKCIPTQSIAEDLISFQVFSFASFLFSSLIALSIKQALKISRRYNGGSVDTSVLMARVNKTMLRVGILLISVGSVCGCGFLMLALVNVVQVKLGKLGCVSGSGYSIAAIVPLVIFVPIALLVNVGLVFYAFTR
ncbi:hypothetical protein ACHQM5_020075 [Ranunculus cassubicifolius]